MLVRPFSSVFNGSYVSEKKSKTVPLLVMLPILPLIQRMKIMPAIRTKLKMPIMIRVMILRFLLTGFFSFFIFFLSWLMGASAALSSPDCSSKSKAWTGLRKSSAELTGVGVEVGVGIGSVTTGCSVTFLVAGFLAVDFLVARFLLVVVLVDFLVVGFLTALGLVVVLVLGLTIDFLVEEIAAFLERVVRPSIDLFLSIVYNYSIMSVKLTKKQLAVLGFLEEWTETHGYSPSYREIMAGLGLSSVSAVAEHIDNLVSKGVLKKMPGEARSLEILDYKHEETVELFKARMMTCNEEEKRILIKAAEILGVDLEMVTKNDAI